MQFAAEQIQQRLRARRPGRKIGCAAWDRGCRAAGRLGCRSFFSRAPARGATRDQDQAIDIHRFRIWETADDKTAKADRQWFRSNKTLQTKRGFSIHYLFMVRSTSRGGP